MHLICFQISRYMNIITIRTFDNYFLANITLSKLQSFGTECYLIDENTVTMTPVLGNVVGGIKLVVQEKDLEDAKKLLQQFDETYLQSVKCPKCGKASITLVTRAGITNFFTAILTWGLSNYAIAPETIYQCGDCKYETKTLPPSINESDLHE